MIDNGLKNGYIGRTILITGGAGYLATNVIRMLRDVSCNVIRLDQEGAEFSSLEGLPKLIDIAGDVAAPDTWEKYLGDADIIFHFAAQTSTYVANADPALDLTRNVLPLVKILEICRRNNWKKTILFSSTVTVVGIPMRLPVNEDFPDNPVTIYDLHKSISEQYLKYYIQHGVASGAILRLSNVYGPGPRSSSADRGVMNQMIRKAIAGNALTVFGEGQFLRDYIYVEDVAMAFLMSALRISDVNGRHFVIGSGQGTTIVESMQLIAERVALKTGRQRVCIEHVEPPSPLSPIEFRNFVADTKRFSEATGWRAQYSLSQGIDETIGRLL